MVWKKMLILKLLSEMIGPDLAREKYGLPLFDEQEERIFHYSGMVKKHRNIWHVHKIDSQEISVVRVNNETKLQRQLDYNQEVHVFAKEDEDFPVAILVASADVYDLTSMIENVAFKLQLLLEFFQLRADSRKVVYQFFKNADYRKSILYFSGFVASNRLERYYGFSEHTQVLVEEFNKNFCRKLKLKPIDYYQAETFFELVGCELFLTPDSVTPEYSWHHFLAAYATAKRCSIWDLAYGNTAQVLLCKREQSFIPVHYITAVISSAEEAEKLMRDLMKQGKKLQKSKADYYLLHVVRNRKDLSVSTLESVAKFLFSEGIQEHHLRDLPYLAENPTVYNCFLEYIRHVYGEEYERIVNELVGT